MTYLKCMNIRGVTVHVFLSPRRHLAQVQYIEVHNEYGGHRWSHSHIESGSYCIQLYFTISHSIKEAEEHKFYGPLHQAKHEWLFHN